MKKFYIFIIITIAILSSILFIYFRNNISNTQENNTSATKLSSKLEDNSNNQNITENTSFAPKKISEYSTEIKDDSDGRLTNINITCSLLNNYILHPGDTFSFNDVVGQPTSDRGYQEATVIIDGEHETGIGGGNCQVSSTLYNAVLDVPNITIIERNEHGLPVTYVPEGQDAAVSYGSLDLKFRNDSDKDIKIEMTTDNEDIIAKLFQI